MYKLKFIVKSNSSFIETSKCSCLSPWAMYAVEAEWKSQMSARTSSRIFLRQFPLVNHAPISLREIPLTLTPPLQCSALFRDIRKMAAAPLYCVCRRPYDFNRFMIECDICKDWFHGRYVNYGLFNICVKVGMYRLPCHGCIFAINQGCHVKVLVTRVGGI